MAHTQTAGTHVENPPPTSARGTQAGWARARYRVGQFLQGFAAQITDGEQELIAEILPPPARALFQAMPRDAQRHSLNVLYAVQSAGFHDPDLAVAALLHDAGKVYQAHADARPQVLGLWWRGPLVILEAVAPRVLNRWASPHPQAGWRYLLYRYLHHPALGATAARQAGCSEPACRLIAHHQDIHRQDTHRQDTHRNPQTPARRRSPVATARTHSSNPPAQDPERFRELLGVLQWADSRN